MRAVCTHTLANNTSNSTSLMQAGAPEVCRLVRPLLEALKLFVSSELHLQKVLIAPGDKTVTLAPPPVSAITTALDTCWRLSPALAHALVLRYPNAGEARSQLHNLTYQTAGKPETLAWPQGALRYADACHAMVRDLTGYTLLLFFCML